MKESIGFIGMGVMGAAMSRNLAKAGFPTFVTNRTKKSLEELGVLTATDGPLPITWCNAPSEVARSAKLILTCVTDGEALREVLFGKDGAASSLTPGSLVVDHSTIAPEHAETIAAELQGHGISFCDAPVTGGDVGARNATLTIIVGGSASDLERARPAFEVMGKNIFHMGAVGCGQRMKAVNQVAIAVGLTAMIESMALAERLGIDVDRALEILSSGSATSWAFQNYAPRIRQGNLQPGFAAKDMSKDLGFATELAAKTGAQLPGLATVHQLFRSMCEQGFGGLGIHGLGKIYPSPESSSGPRK